MIPLRSVFLYLTVTSICGSTTFYGSSNLSTQVIPENLEKPSLPTVLVSICGRYVVMPRFENQDIQGVSGGIVNILGGGSMDYSE